MALRYVILADIITIRETYVAKLRNESEKKIETLPYFGFLDSLETVHAISGNYIISIEFPQYGSVSSDLVLICKNLLN